MDYAGKLQRCHEYADALEEERRKIQVFQRELPLCLELVTQAIEACKKELSGTTVECTHGQQSECSEQTSNEGFTRPVVLEEFIPIKRTNSCFDGDEDGNDENDDDDDDQEHYSHNSHKRKNNMNSKDVNSPDHKKKSDWLRSVQLWNQSPDPCLKEDLPRKAAVTEVKRNGGAFQPFLKEKSAGKSNQAIAKAPSSMPTSANNSTAETGKGGTAGGGGGGSNKKEEKESQTQRKQRRCWSPELHRRFLHALQQLGGSHTATPKLIRELMKVDGLTNDEVKSHLQKYRLHTRRPSPTIDDNNNPQAPQFVVVGGIWVPPPEYAAVATATTASGETATISTAAAANGIYAPVAAPPSTAGQHLVQNLQRSQSRGRESHSDEGGRVRSNSPNTSSSSTTNTTNSLLF